MPSPETSRNERVEIGYIKPVKAEIFKEYISPTSMIDSSTPVWWKDFYDDERDDDEVDRDRSQAQGLLAHKIMEAVGNGITLEEVLQSSSSSLLQVQTAISQENAEEVYQYLSSLKNHPLIEEIENSSASMNEYRITKPLEKYLLYGRLDKIIKSPDGFRILDFKYSKSGSNSDAHEFQMRFYLYLAREIFSPLLGAELFYLKDGISKRIELSDKELPAFEDELMERISRYQKSLSN